MEKSLLGLMLQRVRREYESAESEKQRQHLADVIRTAYESNEALFAKMKEEGTMSETFERIFEKQINEAAKKEKEKTIENMLKDNVNADSIKKWTGASYETITNVAKKSV